MKPFWAWLDFFNGYRIEIRMRREKFRSFCTEQEYHPIALKCAIRVSANIIASPRLTQMSVSRIDLKVTALVTNILEYRPSCIIWYQVIHRSCSGPMFSRSRLIIWCGSSSSLIADSRWAIFLFLNWQAADNSEHSFLVCNLPRWFVYGVTIVGDDSDCVNWFHMFSPQPHPRKQLNYSFVSAIIIQRDW